MTAWHVVIDVGEVDDATELAAVLLSDARRAIRRARRAGAAYVTGDGEILQGNRLRVESGLASEGVWLCNGEEAAEAAEDVERLLRWHRTLIAAVEDARRREAG